jgi:hypothetical protein
MLWAKQAKEDPYNRMNRIGEKRRFASQLCKRYGSVRL